MKSMMKGIATGLLAVAVVIAGQMALTGVAGFHTAELVGGTVLTFLFFYLLFRSGEKHVMKNRRSGGDCRFPAFFGLFFLAPACYTGENHTHGAGGQ